MRLIKLRLQRFMCYLDTTIVFPPTKVTNIYGMDIDRKTANGVGKSAIKEAILFVLHGKTKVNLEELVMKEEKGTVITLEFEVDEKNIEIMRKYRNKATSLDVRVDGRVLDYKTVREKKQYIEELIGMDYETCVNFCIFDSIRFEDLSSLSSSEIKRLLQMLFNYGKFNSVIVQLKEKLSTNNALLDHLKQKRTHFYSERRREVLTKFINSTQKSMNVKQKELELLNNSIIQYAQKETESSTIIDKNERFIGWIIRKANCPTCKKPLDNKTKILNDYQSEINTHKQIIATNQKERSDVLQNINKLKNERTVLERKKNDANGCLIKMTVARKETKGVTEVVDQCDKYRMALEVMKKFEAFVLEHYLKYLGKVINQYLDKLIDIKCKISFLRQGSLMTRSIDKFCLKLYRNEEEFSYMQLSSGERMIVAYAFKLAINTLNFKNTFLFVDEGLNKLDVHNRNKLLKMLQNSPFCQVFLISHIDAFENIPKICITKKNDISTAEVKGL